MPSARNPFQATFTSFLFKFHIVKKDFSDPKITQVTLIGILTQPILIYSIYTDYIFNI